MNFSSKNMHLLHDSCIVLFSLFNLITFVKPKPSDDTTYEDTQENNREVLSAKLSGALERPNYAWSEGLVPYYLDSESYDSIIAHRVRSAMNMIEGSSCVVFLEMKMIQKDYPGNWLHITNPNKEKDCKHQVDTGSNSETILVLGFECIKLRDILHSLLHALGFTDEVTHPQREQFIRIMWENIQPKYRSLFHVRMEEPPYKTVVEYDTMSVMQFHDRAYSINGGATISPIIPGLLISPSEKLSQLDVMKLRLAFGHECNKRKVGKLLDNCQNAMRADADPDTSTSVESDNVVPNAPDVSPPTIVESDNVVPNAPDVLSPTVVESDNVVPTEESDVAVQPVSPATDEDTDD